MRVGICWRLFCALLACNTAQLFAQTFNGSNPPGTHQDIALSFGAGVTNVAIEVSGDGSSFSHLLLKKGAAAPTDTDNDFMALAEGQSNAIHLESPEFAVTNYVLRVRTPANSATHDFTVTVTANTANLRTVARPATKSLVAFTQGSLASNSWHYFRVDVPTNLPGWRVVLYSTNSNFAPDLYIRRSQAPTVGSYLRRSVDQSPDTLFFTNNEATTGAYIIGVLHPGSITNTIHYTLAMEYAEIVNLTWDPGTADEGTQAHTNQNVTGGDYYFRITAQNTALGAWRTALKVLGGEAHVHLLRGALPTPATASYSSERIGSDGFVIPSSAFTAGQEWFLMVRANPASQWTLLTGEPFVTELGTVASDNSSGSGPMSIGPEGMRFFKTTVPANTLAWRLWLNGATNTLLIRKLALPLPGVKDLSQSGQMLVVPNYLVGGLLYFVGVSGDPGSGINLDSRQHTASDIGFISTTPQTVTGYGYTTYRVQVPVDQIAWQVNVVVSNGNPNVALRRNLVPNEFNNDAYSEVSSNVTDSITLVPATLSDGTFFVTVYGVGPHSFTLHSGIPVVTDINFSSVSVNDDPNRAGWRYYRITDLNQQLGALGWDLFLQNFAPGTRIALRRNAVPSQWTRRDAGVTSTSGFFDVMSVADFLQRPAHQADVWYVGVYSPNTALGPFTLITQPLTAEPLAFDAGSVSRANVTPGKWQFFQFNVPADASGWDVRLDGVSGGLPRLVVRRDLLPAGLLTLTAGGAPWSQPGSVTTWPSGNQWAANADWTRRNESADGAVNEAGRILAMGMGRPLQPGTYYVGVLDPNGTNAANYSVLSRGIGDGYSIPVTNLAFNGGSVTNTLPAREAAYYRVVIPTNTPGWKVRLQATGGEVLLLVLSNTVPNVDTGRGSIVGKAMQKLDDEHYVFLPRVVDGDYLPAGTYYLAVVGEGASPSGTTRIGTGTSSYVLTSQGTLPVTDLGELTYGGPDLIRADSLEGGEVKAYVYRTAPDAVALEMRLENKTGNPVMVTRGDDNVPDPGAGSDVAGEDPYGNEGGWPDSTGSVSSPDLITFANCEDGFYYIMVKARASGSVYSNANYTLRIHSVVVDTLGFDGGFAAVAGQSWGTFRYWQVEVPADALGWDIRVTDSTGAGVPHMVVRRGFLPGTWQTLLWNQPGNATSWFYDQWAAKEDWTRRPFSATGASETGRILAMGRGRPLEPGTYLVGVQNDVTFGVSSASYNIRSRGIGPGFSIPVTDLAFVGGAATNAGLAPREAAYYRVQIPPNTPSWQMKVSTNAGEVMLVILSNNVPNVDSGRLPIFGKLMQKSGNEHYVLLPDNGQSFLTPGTFYLAVAGEGVAPSAANRVGTGVSSFVVTSSGPLPAKYIGDVTVDSDIVHDVTGQEGGETRAFRFSVPVGTSSLEVRLENRVGNPVAVVRSGTNLPSPNLTYTGGSTDLYGAEGGYTFTPAATNAGAGATLINIPNPMPGTFTMTVKARAQTGVFPDASYTIRVSALSFTDVAFDSGTATVTNHAANTWRYFRIEVPTNALGWDVRLLDVTNGVAKMVVRRDSLPVSLANLGWSAPGAPTNWPSGNQWAASGDWTRRSSSAAGIDEDFRVLAMGMGRPLEPGTYYVGVNNTTAASSNLAYTIYSRGIGDGMTLPITDIGFGGGSVTNTGLAPREAAYYRVLIPTNSPSVKIRLTSTVGEIMLVALTNAVPNVDTGTSASVPGRVFKKAGNEHYLILPRINQTNAPAETLYLTVVSEGVNPPSAGRVGTGHSGFILTCEGVAPILDLGTVGGPDLVRSDSLEGGEVKLYQFTLPTGLVLETRLENRVGNPVLVLRGGDRVPNPGLPNAPVTTDNYGFEGGQSPAEVSASIITLPTSSNSVHTLAVKARLSTGSIYPDANYTVRIRHIPMIDLSFSPELNTNGLNNVAGGLLLDDQRVYYRVLVPSTLNGAPVLGWKLELTQASGLASIRVRPGALPDDAVVGMPFATASAIIAPPFLTNGTWYVEVRGSGSTEFTLTSRAVTLERAWAMPAVGQPVATPGLTAPEFGDSGTDTNGVPLPVDQGLDLAQGYFHFYSVTVPSNNVGLLRVQLDAISGNPDLYIRNDLVPTLSHKANGQGGTLYDRSLISTVTEYGNFVPFDGQTETELRAGTWHLAVRASGNANARYRLRVSYGSITDLAFLGGNATGQVVAGTDWRYYRVQVPASSTNWQVTFNQQSGDVIMYVRDTIPPGNGDSLADLLHWNTDDKSVGPYPTYDPPGTHQINVPQLRPGSTYYLGFRAINDATFNVSSGTAGTTQPDYPFIEFYGGSVSNQLAPLSETTYRIYTPADASRWKHSATNALGVQFYIRNGTLPTKTSSDPYRGITANVLMNQYLLNAWPWQPEQTYFMTVTNTTASTQAFTFVMDGKSLATDDNDNDGLPDAWERQYFNTTSIGGTTDFDLDGVSNLNEYLEGTNPANPISLRPRLTVNATNCVVIRNPDQTNYDYGTPVTVTVTPNPGFEFIGWSGHAVGLNNPLVLTLNSNHTINASCKVPGDDFIRRVAIVGWSNVVASTNAGATKEPGELNHAGNSGGRSIWWKWIAPGSGNVTVATVGSSFNTLLAVYTGASVSNLTLVANNNDVAPGTNTSWLTFTAVAGADYAVAVDGFNTATGSVSLLLTMDAPPALPTTVGSPTRLPDGRFAFTLSGEPGYTYDILASTNLVNWDVIASLPNPTGTLLFTDTNAAPYRNRYYLVRRQ